MRFAAGRTPSGTALLPISDAARSPKSRQQKRNKCGNRFIFGVLRALAMATSFDEPAAWIPDPEARC